MCDIIIVKKYMYTQYRSSKTLHYRASPTALRGPAKIPGLRGLTIYQVLHSCQSIIIIPSSHAWLFCLRRLDTILSLLKLCGDASVASLARSFALSASLYEFCWASWAGCHTHSSAQWLARQLSTSHPGRGQWSTSSRTSMPYPSQAFQGFQWALPSGQNLRLGSSI